MVALFFRIVEAGKQETGMFRTPVILVGLAGGLFLAGGFIPASLSIAPPAQSEGLSEQALPLQMAASTKGDRRAAPAPASNPSTVSIVELVGLSQATIILRDREGRVLYRSDPRSGVTTFARDTELPVITLKEGAQGPVAQHPGSPKKGNEAQQEQKPKPRSTVGCMGDVSPLVKASANRMPSLCLAMLDRSLS
jgi:hypothetical protein